MQPEQSTLLTESSKYKIVFLGESAVGKTSAVQYIANGSFNDVYQATIYLDSIRKNVTYNGRCYKLMFWDTAGQEKFNSLVPSAIRGSQCAIIMFDLSCKISFQRCSNWIKLLRETSSTHECPAILVGNKSDLERKVSRSQAFDFAVANNMPYIQTSAKQGQGLNNLVVQIIECIQSKIQKSTKSSEQSTIKQVLKSTKLTESRAQIQFKNQGNKCCSI